MLTAVLFTVAMQAAAPAGASGAPAPATATCAVGFHHDAVSKACVADAAKPVTAQPSPTPTSTADTEAARVSEIHKEKKAKVNPFANK